MRITRWLMAGAMAVLLMVMSVPGARAAESMLTRVQGLDRVKAVAASGDHYAALRADGSVWVWDVDADGVAAKPQLVNMRCRVTSLQVGLSNMAMVCADGGVWLADFAINEQGIRKTAQVPGLDSVKAVSMTSDALVALRTDGTVWIVEMAINTKKMRVENLAGITAIAAGVSDFVAIGADGTAWTARAINTKGTGTTLFTDASDVRAVAACGPDADCDGVPFLFVTADGKVQGRSINENGIKFTVASSGLQCSGCISMGAMRVLSVTANGDGRLDVISADGKVTSTDIKKPGPALKQVATGSRVDIGLAADGTVWSWAAPNRPRKVPGLEGITAVASGGDCSLALGANGKVYTWGWNARGLAHELTHVVQFSQIAASTNFYAALGTDGSIATGVCPAPGAAPAEPIIHRDLAARYMSAGGSHIIIIKPDGQVAEASVTVTAAGVQMSEFRPVAGLKGMAQVAAGENGYLALGGDGTLWAASWSFGATQMGSTGSSGASGRAIAAGGNSYAVLLADGSVRGIAIDEQGGHVWGDPHVSDAIAIAAGGPGGGSGGQGGSASGGAIALRANGTVVTFSQSVAAEQVTEILDAVAVSKGPKGCLILSADGMVYQWSIQQLPAGSKS